MGKWIAAFTGLAIVVAFAPATAQTKPESSAAEIAKKLANPIASMISMPMQSNTDVGIGADNGSKLQVNVQPVVPFAITPKLNLITRWIVPVVSQYDVTGAKTSQAGFGDATITAFLGPSNSKLVWGVGPAFLVPIATDDALGTGRLGIGPSIVALHQANGWTVGALANYLVSVAGDETRAEVKSTFVNPFLAYNWASGAGATLLAEYTHDSVNDVDVLVIIPQVSAVTKFGKQTAQFAVGPRLHFSPDGHASYGIRATLALVFPK